MSAREWHFQPDGLLRLAPCVTAATDYRRQAKIDRPLLQLSREFGFCRPRNHIGQFGNSIGNRLVHDTEGLTKHRANHV